MIKTLKSLGTYKTVKKTPKSLGTLATVIKILKSFAMYREQ